MDDAVVPILPTAPIADVMLPPHRFYEPVPGLGENAAAFAYSSDRLVRHLFDVGLQLHTLRLVFDQTDATPNQVRSASDAVGLALDDLDMLIRDAGLAMLALSTDAVTKTTGDGHGPKARKRRR
ncbi:hypothetical protein [Nocardia terpenica]|uniref:Uncharacterized protein n=1 Tax=Nocardia terpenica TaxID=455432 RepID=A0A164JXG9_9NOCA|nr:hypothetical protein [Nocardia terpenica]KZM70819.1 hypothetical protein AWN90_40420 [Nocardia terpenica]NQE89909.1 hypothetical protein [Nocardia terpenica]